MAIISSTSDSTATSSQPVSASSSGVSASGTALNLSNSTFSSLSGTDVGSFLSSTSSTVSDLLSTSSTKDDFRVRVRPLSSSVYGSTGGTNILTPLVQTNGMMFPYSPQISFNQEVSYADVSLTHSNMDYLAYTRTPSVTLNITGKFTVQNPEEGEYALAALHFCRVVSKMYFGKKAGDKAGLPPPVLILNGYGTYMFNDLRCFMKSHSFTYESTMDTVPVSAGGGVTRLPAMFDLTVVLGVQQTPRAMREDFDLDKFRTGELMTSKKGWI